MSIPSQGAHILFHLLANSSLLSSLLFGARVGLFAYISAHSQAVNDGVDGAAVSLFSLFASPLHDASNKIKENGKNIFFIIIVLFNSNIIMLSKLHQ